MKKVLTIFLFAISSLTAFCQGSESDAVKKTIANMFDAMRAGDTVNLKTTLADRFLMYHVNPAKDTTGNIVIDSNAEFFKGVEAARGGHWDERITNYDDVNIAHDVAMVWASYKFYTGSKFDHCGIEIIQLIKTERGWRVVSVFYTVKTGNCPD
jgi:hypothetical protein